MLTQWEPERSAWQCRSPSGCCTPAAASPARHLPCSYPFIMMLVNLASLPVSLNPKWAQAGKWDLTGSKGQRPGPGVGAP